MQKFRNILDSELLFSPWVGRLSSRLCALASNIGQLHIPGLCNIPSFQLLAQARLQFLFWRGQVDSLAYLS
jgi:hypothetical protein